MDVWFGVYHKVWELLSHYYFKYSFLLWYASYVYVISFDIIPQVLDVLGLGFFSLLFEFHFGKFILICLQAH